MGKILGVISLKGGVGKTSSVVALGASLSSFGKKVLLVDGNFSAPNLGIHLDIINPVKSIHNVLSGDEKIENVIVEKNGLHVIPASIFKDINFNPLKLKSKLLPLKDKYDIILIDSSPSLNEETLAVIMASEELLVVTTPDYSTLSMTLKSVNIAKKRGTPISGLILNKVHDKNFELSIEDIERTSDVPVMAVIPHDIRILKSQAYFTPSVHMNPNSSASIEYKKLAATLIGEKYAPLKFSNFFSKITPQRQDINREIFYKSVFQ